jgi:hypothetical protein
MSNDLTWEEEPRIRQLTKEIAGLLNGPLHEKLKELFEGVYGDRCDEEYGRILGYLIIIEQEELPCAEMLFKGVEE